MLRVALDVAKEDSDKTVRIVVRGSKIILLTDKGLRDV